MVGFGKLSLEEAAKDDQLVPIRGEMEALAEVKTLFDEWEPWWQSFFFNHGSNFSAACGTIPALFYSNHLR